MSRSASPSLLCLVIGATFVAAGSHAQQPSHTQTQTVKKPAASPDTNIAGLRRRLAAAPSDMAVREALALAYQNSGRMEAAVEQYRLLRKASPDNPEYMYRLGQAYLAAARIYAERLQAKAPHSTRLLQLQAEKLADEGDVEAAELVYSEAIHKGPKLPGLHLALGRLYAQQGDQTSAIAEADRELAVDPESAEALSFRASLVATPAATQVR